jgi:hypothetical protein
MAALNRIIIPAKDRQVSATFLADGVEPGPQWGPFIPVHMANGVTLDFVNSGDLRTQHHACLVDDREFDEVLAHIFI